MSPTRREKNMANWSEIKTTTEFYPDYPFLDIKQLVGKTFDVVEATAFENEKGPGVAAVISLDGEGYKMVTHSVGITKTIGSDGFMEALVEEPVTVTLKEGKSKKSGKYFYYLE